VIERYYKDRVQKWKPISIYESKEMAEDSFKTLQLDIPVGAYRAGGICAARERR